MSSNREYITDAISLALKHYSHIPNDNGVELGETRAFKMLEKSLDKIKEEDFLSAKSDLRAEKQKAKAENIAKALRKLANVVEKSIVNHHHFDFDLGTTEQEIDEWIHHYLNGEQSIVIRLDIYNPDMDNRNRFKKDLEKDG